MGRAILLTGAPATGKSTLRRNLVNAVPGLTTFDYGKLLLELKAREGSDIKYAEMRNQSAKLISASDVHKTDEMVIKEVQRLRLTSDIILDSHAVTRESYGFRAVPYSAEQLARLRLDLVLVLRCDPEIVINRITKDAQGRRAVTVEMAREHQILQECTGLSYAIACGCPFLVLDTTLLSEHEVRDQAIILLSSKRSLIA